MLAALLLIFCVVLRIVPHPPNFAPVGAAAVLAGRTLPAPLAVALTLATMVVADVALAAIHGWRPFGPVTPFVYGAFALQALLGRALRRRRGGAIAAAALGATGFFLISNLGVWVAGAYGHTAAGLLACYVAAIPFYGATLAGDLVWTVVLSSAYRPLARRLEARGRGWVPVPTSQTAPI